MMNMDTSGTTMDGTSNTGSTLSVGDKQDNISDGDLKQRNESSITDSTTLGVSERVTPTTPEVGTTKDYTLKLDLTEDELLTFVREIIVDLAALEDHANSTALAILKTMGSIYFKYDSKRLLVTELLEECKFAELTASMLREFNTIGIFKNDDVWFPAYYTLNSLWNYSDASLSFANTLCDAGLVKMMIANISHQPYLDNLQSKNVAYIIKSSLSILQNVSKVSEAKPLYRELDGIKALLPFSKSDNDFYKATSMMILTAIMDDDENATLEDTGAIPFMIGCIEKALVHPKRRHRGFTPVELTEGLARMAVNDSNKITIVNANALPQFVTMLKSTDQQEQKAAAKAIWTLSFDKDARERIKEEPDCVETLEELQNCEYTSVKKQASGALWIIQQKMSNNADQQSLAGDIQQSHVFISYSHNYQDMCIAIKDRLLSDGYRVWIDVDAMGGSTLESMATAVENAAVVLVCACERYKLSPNCRTEAEYTYALNKDVVPLMMQRHYKADGWLGMLMGAKFYVNFDGKFEFDKAYELLLKELNDRGKVPNKNVAAVTATVAPTMAAPPAVPAPAARQQSVVMTWDYEEVAQWLEDSKLARLKGVFADYNGRLLCALQQIQREAPEFFYKSLEAKLELNFTDTLLLVDALNSLP